MRMLAETISRWEESRYPKRKWVMLIKPGIVHHRHRTCPWWAFWNEKQPSSQCQVLRQKAKTEVPDAR